MSFQALADFNSSPEMVTLSSQLSELAPLQYEERQRIYNKRKLLRKQALKQYQIQWLEADYDRSVAMPGNLDHLQANGYDSSGDDFNLLRPFMVERSLLADMASESLVCYGDLYHDAVGALATICTQSDQRVLYRPGEAPIDGRCPFTQCGKLIERQVPFASVSSYRANFSKHSAKLTSTTHPFMQTTRGTVDPNVDGILLQMFHMV
ncbi:MAG: hypothetical protein Q9214_007270 [Letrouitia sp. 1 TL-2023]